MHKSLINLYLRSVAFGIVVFLLIPSVSNAQNVKKDTIREFSKTYVKINLLSPTYNMRRYFEMGVQRKLGKDFGMGLSILRYFDSKVAAKRDGETYKGLAGRMEVFYHQPTFDFGLAFSLHKIVNQTFHPVLRRDYTYLQNMLLDRHVLIQDYQFILNWRWNFFNSKNVFVEFFTRFGIQRVFVGYDLPADGYLYSESSWVDQDPQHEKMFDPGKSIHGSFDIGIRIAFGW